MVHDWDSSGHAGPFVGILRWPHDGFKPLIITGTASPLCDLSILGTNRDCLALYRFRRELGYRASACEVGETKHTRETGELARRSPSVCVRLRTEICDQRT